MSKTEVAQPMSKLDKIASEIGALVAPVGIDLKVAYPVAELVAKIEALIETKKLGAVQIAKIIRYFAGKYPAEVQPFAVILKPFIIDFVNKVTTGKAEPQFVPASGGEYDKPAYKYAWLKRAKYLLLSADEFIVAKGMYYVEGWINKEAAKEQEVQSVASKND